MAKNKSIKKKKYVPKPVYFPSIIIAKQAFDPLEKAVNNILEIGELDEDQFGNFVYLNENGSLESFSAGLEIYIRTIEKIVEHYNKEGKANIEVDLSSMVELKESMDNHSEFSETMLINVKKCFQICKYIISKAPPALTRHVALTIAKERKENEPK